MLPPAGGKLQAHLSVLAAVGIINSASATLQPFQELWKLGQDLSLASGQLEPGQDLLPSLFVYLPHCRVPKGLCPAAVCHPPASLADGSQHPPGPPRASAASPGRLWAFAAAPNSPRQEGSCPGRPEHCLLAGGAAGLVLRLEAGTAGPPAVDPRLLGAACRLLLLLGAKRCPGLHDAPAAGLEAPRGGQKPGPEDSPVCLGAAGPILLGTLPAAELWLLPGDPSGLGGLVAGTLLHKGHWPHCPGLGSPL
ncbi:hypothetical protein lerEdw1_004725 [Lerista edwardsae]|nr:hypothetical protein lerEdw1_004725 [Lerista edwardsae]